MPSAQVQTIWCRHFVGDGGDYYFKDWHADRSKTTGLLLQKGAHDLDIIHWLAGAPSRRVTAMGALKRLRRHHDRSDRDGEVVGDWFDRENNWPPRSQRGLHPIIDVEDVSMMLMELENGVLASYQQCHFTPDYWRNYTVIGTDGRLENFGDEVGATVKVWSRRSGYRADADRSRRRHRDPRDARRRRRPADGRVPRVRPRRCTHAHLTGRRSRGRRRGMGRDHVAAGRELPHGRAPRLEGDRPVVRRRATASDLNDSDRLCLQVAS